MIKICSICGIGKDIKEFHKRNESSRDGLRGECRTCISYRGKQYRIKNKDKYTSPEYKEKTRLRNRIQYAKNPRKYNDKRINQFLKKAYNISLNDYNEMLKLQNYECKLCGIHSSTRSKRFAVDHVHGTKIIRGLLCDSCNRGLGLFRDSISVLEKAINYLEINGTYGK